MVRETAQKIDLGELTITQEFVDSYLEAVQDKSTIYQRIAVAPPLALAARVLSLLIAKLSLPSGAIHVSQQVYSQRAIVVGQELWGSAQSSRPLQRKRWTFISSDFVINNHKGFEVLKGQTTVMVPSEELV